MVLKRPGHKPPPPTRLNTRVSLLSKIVIKTRLVQETRSQDKLSHKSFGIFEIFHLKMTDSVFNVAQ